MIQRMLQKIITCIMIASVLLGQMTFVVAHAETYDLKSTVEQQVRAYAKSIYRANADDEVTTTLAKHGLTGRGKDLNLGSSSALTVTIMNSELMQVAFTESIYNIVKIMDKSEKTMSYLAGSVSYEGADGDGYYSTYIMKSKTSASYHDQIDRHLCKENYSGKINEYDESLEWTVSDLAYVFEIQKKQTNGTETVYVIDGYFMDHFDFELRGNDVFKDLLSGIGAALFKEFTWKSTFHFEVKAPTESCDHQLHTYEFSYDKSTNEMMSVTGQGLSENKVTRTLWTREDIDKTYTYFSVDETIRLLADEPWVLEIDFNQLTGFELSPIKSSGTELYPSIRFIRGSYTSIHTTAYKLVDGSYPLMNRDYSASLQGITISHNNTYTCRYENIIDNKGVNRIYVTIFDSSTGKVLVDRSPLDDFVECYGPYNQSGLVNANSTWTNGRNLYINYIGTTGVAFSAGTFNMRVYEGGKNSSGSAYATTKTVQATCTSDGYTVYTCTRCNHSYNGDIVKATGHNYGDWKVTKEPDCVNAGIEARLCATCNQSDTREIKALGHVEIEVEGKEPTCTEPGIESGAVCERCEEIVSGSNEMEPLGHEYESEVIEPTCIDAGYTVHTCVRCEETYTDAEVKALGHSYGEWETEIEPTPEKDGVERRECEKCEHFETREVPYIVHDYTSEVIEPTCTEMGYTLYTCTECGETYKDEYTEMIDHEYGEWYVETAPTHNEKGVERRECMHCEAYETQDIEVEEHQYTTEVIAATCTEQGYTLYTCECGETYKEDYTDMIQHSYGEAIVVVPADCLNAGKKMHVCEACGYEETIHVEPLGHDYQTTVVEATCLEAGYSEHACRRCEESYRDNETQAKGHQFTQWSEAIAATCLEGGLEMRDCEACDHYETRESEALGHEYEEIIVNPDCINQGYTKHQCIRCEENYADNYVESSGHGYTEWSIIKEATCLEEGLEERYCTGCQERQEQKIEALGHDTEVTVIEATCLETGYTVSECARCGAYEKYDETEALGHEYESEIHEPTCSMVGYTEHKCVRCEDSYMNGYVQTLPHEYGQWQIVEAPTLEKEGLERRECRNCEGYQTRVMAKTEHQYTSKQIEPTCDTEGYMEYTCTVCGHVEKDNYVEALGHKYGEWIIHTEAGCSKPGVERRDCEVCGKFEIRTTDVAGHDYAETVIEPDCTQMGYTIYKCTRCSATSEGNYVAALGHRYGEWVDLGEVKCLEKGAQRRDCEACDHYEVKETEAMDHRYEAEVKEATCLESGYTTYTCARCADSYVSEETEALGHDYELTIKKATCLEAGSETNVCRRCEDTQVKTLEALGHKYVTKTTPATCVNDEIIKEVCEHCQEVKSETTGAKALGHDRKTKEVAATCTQGNYTLTYCTRCDETSKSNQGKALGHSFGQYISNNNATIYKDGTKTAKCSTCGAKDTISDPGTKKVISDLKITKEPEKTEYALNEELDLRGLELTATYTDGTSETITECPVSGYDATKTGEQTLTLSYGETSVQLNVIVGEAEDKTEETVPESPEKEQNDTEGGKEIPAGVGLLVLGGILVGMSLLGKKLLFKKKPEKKEEMKESE